MLQIYSSINLDKVYQSGQCFRWSKDEINNKYKVVAFGEVIKMKQHFLNMSLGLIEVETNLDIETVARYLDVYTPYIDLLSHIDNSDEFLRNSIESGRGLHVLQQDLHETIISFLISQNNNIKRIKKSIDLLCRKYGNLISDTTDYTFPTREDMLPKLDMLANDTELGLGYRLDYIVQAFERDTLEYLEYLRSLNYESAMKELISHKGIGAKVANCICLYGLHHINACPIDTWMKRIINEDYNGNQPEWMTSQYAGIYQQFAFDYKRR